MTDDFIAEGSVKDVVIVSDSELLLCYFIAEGSVRNI